MSHSRTLVELLSTVMFAADRHKNQRRKDAEASPYINNPISLAHLLSTTGEVQDINVLRAAILHDTIEDTETTYAKLLDRFGVAVANIVQEVTDDKSLPESGRKELLVEHARHKSREAALVNLADKICNLRDIANSPPSDWPLARRQECFDWAKRVVDGLPDVSAPLKRAFEEAYSRHPVKHVQNPTERDGHWLSMPGALRGTSGFVRVLDSGDIEVELYDHSQAAESAFDDDVSTIYTIDRADLKLLSERLAIGFGGPPPNLAELPDRLTTFLDVQSLIEWLVHRSDVPVRKRMDFDV